ncbi:DNA binding [Ascochyta rabiei]|uniref:DNA binding n=1 Tax=Didymella rabiei TaxID=5454 RepID=A0A163MDH2_DIDRA|nr:DNA binding [Ascochyta rabiei]
MNHIPPHIPSPSSLAPHQYEQEHNTLVRPQSQQSATIDFLPSGTFATDFLSGTLTPSGLIGYGGEIDLDFSAIDLNFLNTYNTRVPFEAQTPVDLSLNPHNRTTAWNRSISGEGSDAKLTHGNISNSIWRFVPVPGVHGYSEQGDLSIPTQDHIEGTPESLVEVRRRATTEKLDSAARDKILAIIFSQVRSHILPALSAFPSVMLLDKLIQFFLAGPTPSARTWIHTASFVPGKARPELLLAMAAAGAVLTPDRSLRKLGFAIQEVVRNHAPTVWEADNTLVRDLEMSQAYMLQLAIGLWSGSSRKIEISESFQQPLLSMLRRGNRFRRSSYSVQVFGPEDVGFVLEQKWRTWVQQESFKRLVYHLLSHDAQASMSLLTNPAISYSELDLPLPEPQELWLAGSAEEWKEKYQTNTDMCTTRSPSLTECLAIPDLMQERKMVIDFQLSCSAFLYAMWGMVWEYRKLARLFFVEPNRNSVWDSRLTMMTRQQELLKVFDYYRVIYPNENMLLLELILMHLHTSLEELQHFCGLGETLEDTSHVQASMKEWASSKAARSAVWHAGQVVRAARQLPPSHLRDFYAISLFHVSLTFWAFGLASRMFSYDQESVSKARHTAINLQQVVHVDDEETLGTYRYTSLGVGTPVMHNHGYDAPLVPLSDLTDVMSVMIDIMGQGDSDPLMPNSPLVENLLNTMRRIRDTTIAKDST